MTIDNKIGENIKYLRKRAHYSQEQIARKLGITQGSISSWETGRTTPDTKQFLQLANIFGVSTDIFFSESPLRDLDAVNIRKSAVPIVGSIACGEPITAEQNIEGFADLPEGVHADFALKCKGDSMEPTFEHNDLVLIRQTPDVQNGQIAAIGVDGEALLKRIYRQADQVVCVSENPAYAPQIFSAQDVTIYGLAVGYVRIW